MVVRGFVKAEACRRIAEVLRGGEAAWHNWNLNGDAASDVDKAGLVSSEALQSFDAFRQYLDTRPGGGGLEARLDAALREALADGLEAGSEAGAQQPGSAQQPAQQHPFDRLQADLDAAHPEGCRRAKLGKWELPTGTFRRMRHSTGLIHADTTPRLSSEAGEFAANLYLSTAPGQGSLSIFPVQQHLGIGQAAFGAPQLATPASWGCLSMGLPLHGAASPGSRPICALGTSH